MSYKHHDKSLSQSPECFYIAHEVLTYDISSTACEVKLSCNRYAPLGTYARVTPLDDAITT